MRGGLAISTVDKEVELDIRRQASIFQMHSANYRIGGIYWQLQMLTEMIKVAV